MFMIDTLFKINYTVLYSTVYISMGPYGVPGSLSMGPYGVPGSRDSWTRGLGTRDQGSRGLGTRDLGSRDLWTRAREPRGGLGTRALEPRGGPGNPINCLDCLLNYRFEFNSFIIYLIVTDLFLHLIKCIRDIRTCFC